jgi:hypothetical protein
MYYSSRLAVIIVCGCDMQESQCREKVTTVIEYKGFEKYLRGLKLCGGYHSYFVSSGCADSGLASFH